MSSITRNSVRNGSFTSSEIVALLSMGTRPMTEEELAAWKKNNPKSTKKNIESWPGKAAVTYIEECNMERRLGRTLEVEKDAAAFTYGHLCEFIAFNKLGLEYVITSDQTDVHPTIPYWCGSKDGYKVKDGIITVVDYKCPITMKSFCLLVDALYMRLTGMDAMNHIRENHPDGEKYYWQLVSNACINGATNAELIVFMPYKKFLPDIRMEARNQVGDGPAGKFYWILNAEDEGLPYLVDDGFYKDINVIAFEVPEEDKQLLTRRIKEAGKMLIDPVTKQLQAPDGSTPYEQTELKKPVNRGTNDLLV